jgi:hypothetical protein
MTVDEMVAQAQMVCAQNGRVYPSHLRQMASQWSREGISIASIWGELKNALGHGWPIEPIDNLIRRRHAEKVAVQDARLKASCPPWPEGGYDVPYDQVAVMPAPKPKPRPTGKEATAYRETTAQGPMNTVKPRLARTKRESPKTDECAAFLRLALNRGPQKAEVLEAKAREQLIIPPGTEMRHYSPMRNARKRLGIEVRRHGFGADGYWLWQFKAPAWTTRASEVGE